MDDDIKASPCFITGCFLSAELRLSTGQRTVAMSCDNPLPFCRLRVGHHQAHHLTWRAQERCAGRSQHRYHAERSPRGAGVPPQKWTDSSVRLGETWCDCRCQTAPLSGSQPFHLCSLNSISLFQYLIQ